MITYAFLTGNARKAAEYEAQLKRYGRAVTLLPYANDETQRLQDITAYLQKADEKDRFVLRETSNLYVAADWDNGVATVSAMETQSERVYHVSKLTVYTLDAAGTLTHKTYTAQIAGSIDLTRAKPETDHKAWWDDIFCADRSSASYAQERDLWGKASARQQAIGQFICDHLIFKRLRDVNFNPHKPTQAVDFAPELSAQVVLRNNGFVRMAALEKSPWGLGKLLTNLVNEGAFFRSPDSRRSGNYFCPPISGIPRQQKADPFWETTYQIHDFFHQAIPDQLFSGVHSPAHRNVYVAARLMSEALTIVMADMLFVEAIKDAGFVYDYSTRKINPLFGNLALPAGAKRDQLKALLKANVAFANLGDDSLYKQLLLPGNSGEQALAGYAETYTHFFVPDLLWSAGNYDDMASRKEYFAAWVELAGRDLFKRARLPLLDELVDQLQASGADLTSYESCVMPVFEYMFEQVVAPKMASAHLLGDGQARSNAFLRYMIGQLFAYAVYRNVDGMATRGRKMVTMLRGTAEFSRAHIEKIRETYQKDLAYLAEQGIITKDDLLMYCQIFPIFSPQFLSYDFDKATHSTVPEAIKAAFAVPVKVPAQAKDNDNSCRRVIDGVVYLDETRLWQSVSTKDVPPSRRLSKFMAAAGVRFFDEEEGGYNFVSEPVVAVTGFGGIPVRFDKSTAEGHVQFGQSVLKPADILAEIRNTMGRAGFYSYMNTGNHDPLSMDVVTSRHRHFSKAHTAVVDLAILGYSAAIEGNLMLQRQWFNHVGRNTNTRTASQCDPPLVVLDPRDLETARAVRQAVHSLVAGIAPPLREKDIERYQHAAALSDHYERINALWPNSRALILMVNADVANLRGTMGDIADKGQELEARRILALANDCLWGLFPEMFQHSIAYGYQMPAHWPSRPLWEQAALKFAESTGK